MPPFFSNISALPRLQRLSHLLAFFFSLTAHESQAKLSAQPMNHYHTVVALTEAHNYLSCPYEMKGHRENTKNARDRIAICLSGDGYYDSELLQVIGSKDWFSSEHFKAGTVNEVRVVCSDRGADIPEIAQAVFPTAKESRRGHGIRLEIPCHFKPSQATAAMESLRALVFTAKQRPEKFLTHQQEIANECADSKDSKSCATLIHAIATGIQGNAPRPLPGNGLRFNQYSLFNFGLTDAPRARVTPDPLGLSRWIKNIYQPLDKEADTTERLIIKLHQLLEKKLERRTTCNDDREFSIQRRDQCVAKIRKLTSLFSQMGVTFHPGGKITVFDRTCASGFTGMPVKITDGSLGSLHPSAYPSAHQTNQSAICAASVIVGSEIDDLLSVIAEEALTDLRTERFLDQKHISTLLPSGATLEFGHGGWYLDGNSDGHLCNTDYSCHLNSAWVKAQIDTNYVSKYSGKHTIVSASYEDNALDMYLLSE